MNFRGSVYLENIHHAYAQTDGTYAWPNSREGDMLRRAKLEIEMYKDCIERLEMMLEVAMKKVCTE